MKTFDIDWFNASPKFARIAGVLVKPYNLFHRRLIATDNGIGRMWGIGLLQIGGRHLFYVGNDVKSPRVYIAFICIL